MKNNETLYEVLGVAENATGEEIGTAYNRLAWAFDPNRHAEQIPEIQELIKDRFCRIWFAWDILCRDDKRQRYDRNLAILRGIFNLSSMSSQSGPHPTQSNPDTVTVGRLRPHAFRIPGIAQAIVDDMVEQAHKKRGDK
ncbi:MAG: J domain-containing protein [Patescibacteria group bacterium]|jgi:DnaJ-class molecular chaperone